MCTYYLPRTLAKFRARHPGVQISLREANQDALLDALEAGDLDLVILARVVQRGRAAAISSAPRARASCARSGSTTRSCWSARPGADPKTASLVTFAHGATTRTLVDRYFPGVPIAMELGSIAAVKGNTRAGSASRS